MWPFGGTLGRSLRSHGEARQGRQWRGGSDARSHWSQAMKTKLEKPKGKGACPSFLFARWREIRHGGARGYREFGSELVAATGSLAPFDDSEEAWSAKV